jgi:hypothetical protein
VEIRAPLNMIFAIGCFGWPIGGFFFGGVEDPIGGAIIGIGSLMVLGAMGLELALRRRAQQVQARRHPSP